MNTDFHTKLLQAISVKTISVLFVAMLASTGLAEVAHAQNTTEPLDGAYEIEELVVIGRLRGTSESIQDVPLAVTVISPQQLAAQGAIDIQDLDSLSPNLVIDPVSSGPGGGAIAIRGVSFEDIEKSFEPTVGLVIDGVFAGTNTGTLTNVFDFEQIEVLRGPQGTLFGRNTIGGVINIKRSRPTKEFGLKAETTLGRFGRQEFNGVLNFGLGDGFGLKLFGSDRQFDGFYENVTLGVDAGANNNTNFGVTFLGEINDSLEVLVTLERSELDGDAALGSASNGTDLICLPPEVVPFALGGTEQCDRNTEDDLYTVFSESLSDFEFEEDSVIAQINYDFGNLKLTSITGYKTSDEFVNQDFDSTSVPFFLTSRPQDYEQFSQEFRLAGDFSERISGVVGLYYFTSNFQLEQTTNLLVVPVPILNTTDHEVNAYAVFGDFDYQVNDKTRVSVGGRYSFDEKEFLRNETFSNEDDWSEFTPRLSVDYQPTEDNLLYASYSRGYRSGGFNGRADAQVSIESSFEPETADAFEIGSKNTFANGRVDLNVAAFVTLYDDKQEDIVQVAPGTPTGQETVTLNAASATIIGFEADLRARFSERFTVTASLGLLDAEYDDFLASVTATSPLIDVSTRELRRAPDYTFSLAGNYDTAIGSTGTLNLNAKFSTRADFQTTIVGDPADFTVNDARGVSQSGEDVSASITYTFDLADGSTLYIRAFGRNLLDDRGLNSFLPVAGLFSFASGRPPREFGVTIGGKF